jgi:Flp pilus assembly secretin CpaC
MLTRASISVWFVLVIAVSKQASAQDFEIEPRLFRGDPNGTREAGTKTLISAPTLVTKSGQRGGLLVGGEVLVGRQLVPVGHQVFMTATDGKDGAIVLAVVYEFSEAIGPAGAQQVTSTKTQTTATVQSGGRVRLELGKDSRDRHWVEITVRKAK